MPRASVTVVARSTPSQTQGSTTQTNSSFFTFLIALLILVFASGALVLRALLIRRRFRRRLQQAIDAGIIPALPSLQDKPELYDVCIRSAGDAVDWGTMLPICVTDLGTPQKTYAKRAPNTPMRTTCHPSIEGHLMALLGHRYTPTSVAQQPVPSHDPESSSKSDFQHSTLQVAVLIAMPTENPCIPPLESRSHPGSPKGKRRESAIHDDAVPDVMLGVNTFAVMPDTDDS